MSEKQKRNDCSTIETLLVDYLDNELDQKTRKQVDQHLAQCASCRQRLAEQESWMKYRPSVVQHLAQQCVPEGMNNRIIEAIRVEASNASKAAGLVSKRPLYFTRKFWYRTATSAAAVLLLFVAFQIFQNIKLNTQKTGSEISLSSDNLASNEYSSIAGQDTESNDSKGATSSGTGGWQIYSGSLFDLPSASCLFNSTNQTSRETTTAATTKQSTVTTTQGNTSKGDPISQDLLSKAEELHVLYTEKPNQRTLILAAYSEKSIDEQLKMIKSALTTCESTIRIEIIRTEDLTAKLDSLDKNLYPMIFTQPSSQKSWIFILVGE